MKEHLIGKKEKKTYFIKKAMEAYIDALYQEAQCLDLRKKILCNRALINLWLKNYGKVIEDCIKAISIDKTFLRPYVRACEALLALKKYEKCIKMADKGLLVEKGNKILKDLKKQAEKELEIHNKILKKKEEAVPSAPPKQEVLLEEIRDLLKK